MMFVSRGRGGSAISKSFLFIWKAAGEERLKNRKLCRHSLNGNFFLRKELKLLTSHLYVGASNLNFCYEMMVRKCRKLPNGLVEKSQKMTAVGELRYPKK